MPVATSHRQLFEVPLEPVLGTRFQPTGFPDLGPALFDRPMPQGGTVQALLVESAQSMANRLKGCLWDAGEQRPAGVVGELPYVRVADADGIYLTSSREEAHRLASAFVKDAVIEDQTGLELIRTALDLHDDRPIPARQIAWAVLGLDPMCLLHGVFFADAKWPGQPKIARALTSFIEATSVNPADNGGVKRDHVRHSLGETEEARLRATGPCPTTEGSGRPTRSRRSSALIAISSVATDSMTSPQISSPTWVCSRSGFYSTAACGSAQPATWSQ